jgi:tRNA1Val (adenine37-N6)-methyltransferase
MRSEVTKDHLKLFDLQILQPRHGYRYSLDPLLLARFCGQVPTGGKVVDLGAGCGIIALVLARLNPTASLVALENNPQMAALIEQNIDENALVGQVTALKVDVINYRNVSPDSSFDLVVSNPPFRTPVSGRVSPRAGRDAARHETTAGLADFLTAAKYLVKPSGRICIIHLPARLVELAVLAAEMKLSILRLRLVHNNVVSPATMFLVELAKGRRTAPVVEAPLLVRDIQGEYTDEVWR